MISDFFPKMECESAGVGLHFSESGLTLRTDEGNNQQR